jgi:iron complex outermembrane receptor protein
MRNLRRTAAACAALYVGVLDAQSLDYAAFEALFGEPVTTSVTGSPQRSSEVPASMIIVTAEDIRRSAARDLPGVLSRFVGLDVDRYSSEHADVAVRGYNEAFSPRLLVLVDGRQVYADYYGFTPWSAIPVELSEIRQIEVVKGPNGALFGFNAVGGVVNIVTTDPGGDDFRSSVQVTGGTQNLFQASAVDAFRFGDHAALRLSAGVRRSDEFGTPRGAADLPVEYENERNSISADLHVRVTPNVVTGVEATYSSVRQYEMPPIYVMSNGDYETASLRTHWEADTGFGLIQAELYRNSISNTASVAASAPLMLDNDVLVAQLEDVFKVGTDHVLRIAAEYRDNSMATTPIEGGSVSFSVHALTAAWNWQITPVMSVVSAVRTDRWQLGREGFLPPELVVQTGLTNEAWDITRDESSFNFGLVLDTQASGTFKLSAGRANQLPNLFNLGGYMIGVFGTYLAGTPDLRPSDIRNLGLRWERGFDGAGMNVAVELFGGETKDVQAYRGNVGSSDTKGVEALVTGQINDYWQWDASVLVQSIDDDLTAPAESTFVAFEQVATDRVLKAHLAWSRGAWEVDAYVRNESDSRGLRAVSAAPPVVAVVPVPSHTALDARAAYAVSDRLQVSLTARNLTNSEQRQTSAPAVERQVFATVDYSF